MSLNSTTNDGAFNLRGASGASAADTLPALTVRAADPELVSAKRRRRFTDAYKVKVIDHVDTMVERGAVGAYLRSEGLYYATLAKFRRQKACGSLSGGPVLRPSKSAEAQTAVSGAVELERENRKLKRQLAYARKVIDIQKKVSAILGTTLDSREIDEID